jgi:hypothetical protein
MFAFLQYAQKEIVGKFKILAELFQECLFQS